MNAEKYVNAKFVGAAPPEEDPVERPMQVDVSWDEGVVELITDPQSEETTTTIELDVEETWSLIRWLASAAAHAERARDT